MTHEVIVDLRPLAEASLRQLPRRSLMTAEAVDVGQLTADGRLQRVTGFFGELPAQAAV